MKVHQGSFESAAEELAEVVEKSVASAVEGQKRVAVAFSGGLDSSILVVCARRYTEVVACSAYSEGAHDDWKAPAAARRIGVEGVATRLTPEMVKMELGEIGLPFEATLMDRSLWVLYSVVSRSAAGAGAGVILLGQLSDELFGGYAKYRTLLERQREGAAEALMRRDVEEYGKRGRVRDYGA